MKQNIKSNSNITDEEIWLSAQVADDKYIYDAHQGFERFKQRIVKSEKKPRLRFLYHNWTIAAVFTLLLGFASFLSYNQGKNEIQNHFTDIIVEAPLGSKSKVCLPDGTVLWLNAGSKVSYSQGFGVENRVLALEGEGYFEVTKNKKVPFIVHTADVDVTVLGTKFNFRNYSNDKEAIVELIEGKVSLINQIHPNEISYLSPMEKMVMDKESGAMSIIRSDDVAKSSEWTNNILFFNEELLPDIVQELERSYGIEIEIQNPTLIKSRFYGSFNRQNQNIFDVLDLFVQTGRLKYIVENDIIYLK